MALVGAHPGPSVVSAAELLISNARLIDGTGSPPREGVSILIRDGRIAEIAAGGINVEGVP